MPRNNSPNIYFRIDQFRWNILKRQNADNIEEWLCPDFKQNIAIREGSPPTVTIEGRILSLRSVLFLS